MDRNFNTSFFEPALRHSSLNNESVNFEKIIIEDRESDIIINNDENWFLINRHTDSIKSRIYKSVKIRELSGGALINESEFLGPVNNELTKHNLINSCFYSSVVSIRLAEAKNHLKTGSTNGLPEELCSTAWEIKERDKLCAGVCLDDFSIPIPEQVQSHTLIQGINTNIEGNFSLSVVKTYNGNPGRVYMTTEANFIITLLYKILIKRLSFWTFQRSKSF